MPNSFRLIRLLICCLFLTGALAGAQTDLNRIHVLAPQAVGSSFRATDMPAGLKANSKPIRKNVDLVLVPVTVTDPMNRLVVGLTQNNFQVFEDRKRQPLKCFFSDDAPVSVGVILDTSGSMTEKGDRAREAVSEFFKASNPQDEFFLITLGNNPQLLSDFTMHPENILSKLLPELIEGRTPLLDAIKMGIQQMQQARYSRKALLVISDGGDNHSRLTEGEIKSVLKEADVALYAIGVYDRYAPTPEEQRGPSLMSEITEVTGGQSLMLDNPNDLPEVAARIGMEIRNEYVLAYRLPSARDGKWHKIRVKLNMPRDLAFLKVHAKQGYYAPLDESAASDSPFPVPPTARSEAGSD